MALSRIAFAVGAGLRAVHRAPGAVPARPDRRREGAQEEVREADGQVLRQPGEVPGALHQETGHRAAGGRTLNEHKTVIVGCQKGCQNNRFVRISANIQIFCCLL